MVTIIKRIIAEQGEAILGDAPRLKGFVADYASQESKAERLAFGRCIEYGAYSVLKSATDRAATKAALARKVHDSEGLDIMLCNDALDALEAALFGTGSGSQTRSVYTPPPFQAAQTVYTPPQPTARVSKNKPIILAVVAVALVLIIIGVNYRDEIVSAFSDWQGFENFEDFSKIFPSDNFLGREITEEEFSSSMILLTTPIGKALLANQVSFDIVSGDLLTERYKVPKTLRKKYNYLINRQTRKVAFFDGETWIVIAAKDQ
jgi:hypothetical protein